MVVHMERRKQYTSRIYIRVTLMLYYIYDIGQLYDLSFLGSALD